MKRLSACLIALCCGSFGCAADLYSAQLDGEREVAQSQQDVQLLFEVAGRFDYVLSDVMNSTASIHIPLTLSTPDGDPGGASCGISFISPHYAITAAHCVDTFGSGSTIITENDPQGRTPTNLTVRTYDTKNLTSSAILNQSTVTGTTLAQFERGTTLTTNDGYNVTSYTCKVTLRCGYSPVNCPSGSVDGAAMSGADVALIHCPTRANNASYGLVATSDLAIGGQVEMYWFHEVLNLYALPPINPNEERWTKYGLYSSNLAQNWHYRSSHQLIPLVSSVFGSTPYKRMGDATTAGRPSWIDTYYKNDPYNSWTDLYFCHGSSGSGVFQRGSTVLLGPLSVGSQDPNIWSSVFLCESASGTANMWNSGYTKPKFVRKIEQLSIVLNDR